MDKTLGQKIKKFREQKGLSQFRLENLIEASPGSLSRIENGEVNPTKETLQKIIAALDLRISEATDLFELSLEELPKLIRLAKKISSSFELDEMLDISVNNILKELNLSGVIIFLIEDGYLYAVAIDDAPPGRDVLLKLLGLAKFRLRLSMSSKSENLCIKCVKENKPYVSYEVYDFTMDVLNRSMSNLIAKINNFKSGIVMPMNINDKVIGAVLYTKTIEDNFERELSILEAFNDYLASSINNVKEYEKIKTELDEIKHAR